MIHVIINPAAGQDVAVLATINSIFHPADVEWDVSITLKKGDARRQAQEAVEKGAELIAVYGGDGTVAEAASGLLESDVPLAILPGGTGNVVARELNVPLDLAEACKLIIEQRENVRSVDVGQVNDECFLLRVSVGTEANIMVNSNREMKDRLGFLAYIWSAAQSLSKVEQVTYDLTIDGKDHSMEGVSCSIINVENIGVANLQIIPDVHLDDGLLDIIVVRSANLPAFAELIGNITGLMEAGRETDDIDKDRLGEHAQSTIQRWSGKEIRVRANPTQSVQFDGEVLEADEIHCRIVPKAVRIVVPA